MAEVVVLGAGALGSVYGGAFALGGAEVTLLARPAHADAITASGLRLDVLGEPRTVAVRATADPLGLPPEPDVVLVAAKAHDVGPMVRATTLDPRLVFSVQNGVGKDDVLVDRFGRDRVVGCAAMVGGTLLGPGHAAYTFSGATYLGDLRGGPSGGADEVARLVDGSGILDAVVRDDIESVVWSKAVLAVAAMGAVGLARVAYHRVFLDDDLAALFLDLVDEAAAVAAAEEVALVDLPGPLQVATLVAATRPEGRDVLRAVGEQLVATGQTAVRVSVLQSIERGRPTEVDAIHADVLARAARHGIDAPVLRTTTRVLRAVDAAARTGP